MHYERKYGNHRRVDSSEYLKKYFLVLLEVFLD